MTRMLTCRAMVRITLAAAHRAGADLADVLVALDMTESELKTLNGSHKAPTPEELAKFTAAARAWNAAAAPVPPGPPAVVSKKAPAPADEPDSTPEPPAWPWTALARWVRPAKGDDTYEAGKHNASLLALAERIERERLRPELVGRFLTGLDAAMLRALAAEPRTCATVELHEALLAFHDAADRIAATLPDVSPPAERLDLNAAGAWIDRLHPVIPPGADIVHLRPNQDPERMRGKAPGVPTHAGSAQWHAVSWRPYWEPGVMADRRATLQRMVSEGANVGLRLGAGADGCNLIALDLDTESDVTRYLLPTARRFVRERTGLDAPLRFGREGRAMVVLRCKEAIKKAETIFDGGQKIECLAEGQQIAFDGQHPSNVPYRTAPLLHELVPTDLPELTVHEVAELMRELRELAEVAGLRVVSKADARVAGDAKAPPNPDDLAGDIEEARELMALIPSPDDRHLWVEILAALKGATSREPGAGLELALDWSHHDSEEEIAETERVWTSLVPHSGIAELRRHAGRPSSRAEDVFTVQPAPADVARDATALFADGEAAQRAQQRANDGASYLAKIDPVALSLAATAGFDDDPPPLDAIVSPLAIRGAVSMLSGDGGTGKSMFVLGLAYEIATGVPFVSHGPLQVNQRGRVLFLTAEETASDLARRRSFWRQRAAQISTGDVDYVAQLRAGLGSVCIVPTTDATVTLYRSGKGATEALAELEALCRRIDGLDVLIVDPVGSYAAMDPTKELGEFVMVLRALAARQGIAVILLHHISKGAANHAATTGDDLTQHASLGSVMGVNSARVAANLQRMPKEAAASWGIAEEDAHEFVGLNVPKANGTAPIIAPVWFRNVNGVPVPANLAHREKVDVKREAAEKEHQTRNQRLLLELLRWCTDEYKPAGPPAYTLLSGVLHARVGGDEKLVRHFVLSQVSRGALILDPTAKQSGNSKGGVRPGNLDLLRQEIAPPPTPSDPSEMFDARKKSPSSG